MLRDDISGRDSLGIILKMIGNNAPKTITEAMPSPPSRQMPNQKGYCTCNAIYTFSLLQ